VYQSWDQDSAFPALGGPFFEEHLARYRFCQQFVQDKEVLELACGKGYGSHLLAHTAKRVLAIDLNEESLDFANQNYKHPALEFRKADVTQLEKISEFFDVIVAFETIEHLPPQQTEVFLRGIADKLKPSGAFLVSTPNHAVVRKSGVEIPEFHINNFSANELKNLLQRHFSKVEMYGQVRSRGLVLDVAYGLDLFHTRHLLKRPLRGLLERIHQRVRRHNSQEPDPSTAASLQPWTPEQGWGGSTDYFFSPWFWRQAGMTLAVCRKV